LQLFESEFLDAARARARKCEALEFYGDVAVIVVGASLIARLGYYCIYGKEGGAAALPKRHR
jgi:hypothetical protein